jgi:hypothetical protein
MSNRNDIAFEGLAIDGDRVKGSAGDDLLKVRGNQ